MRDYFLRLNDSAPPYCDFYYCYYYYRDHYYLDYYEVLWLVLAVLCLPRDHGVAENANRLLLNIKARQLQESIGIDLQS